MVQEEVQETNPYDYDLIRIHNGHVSCPWWKESLNPNDPERGCFTECEFGNGTCQGQGVECLWRAEGSPSRPE